MIPLLYIASLLWLFSGCPNGWMGVNSEAGTVCYKMFQGSHVNWNTAQNRCRGYGSSLASARNMDELIFLTGLRATFYREWWSCVLFYHIICDYSIKFWILIVNEIQEPQTPLWIMFILLCCHFFVVRCFQCYLDLRVVVVAEPSSTFCKILHSHIPNNK